MAEEKVEKEVVAPDISVEELANEPLSDAVTQALFVDPKSEETEETEETEEDPDDAKATKGLDDKQKKAIQKRINKLTAQRKEVEAKVEESKSLLESRDADIADLEGRLEQARKGVSMPMEAEMMQASTDAELREAEGKLEDMIDWCEDHLDEDFESEDGEMYTVAQVRKRLRKLQKFEKRIVPKAREVLKSRKESMTEARKSYPDLFDKNTEAGQRYRRVLLDYPELKGVPNLPILLGDAFAGEALRKAPAKKKALPKKAPASPKQTPKKHAPVDKVGKEEDRKGVDYDAVISSGGSRDALASAVMNLI